LTFGIEFEMNLVDLNDKVTGEQLTDKVPRLDCNWQVQRDITTSLELSSPIFRFIREACDSIKMQFYSMSKRGGIIPYSYNANYHCDEKLSMSGQHIHIAPEMNTEYFDNNYKNLFVKHARLIHPLLLAISAQPLPSVRMYSSLFCKSLAFNRRGLPTGVGNIASAENDQSLIAEDYMPYKRSNHQQEMNYSRHGTVEFRAFDVNIPQCSLVESWILNKICLHSIGKYVNHKDIEGFDAGKYSELRDIACMSGLSGLPITEMLVAMKDMMIVKNKDGEELEYADEVYSPIVNNEYVGSVDNFECDSIRDILFMLARYNLSPSDVYHIVKPVKNVYFRKMFCNPERYLANMVEIASEEFKPVFAKMLRESKQIETFDNLIEVSRIIPSIKARNKIGQCYSKQLTREMVANNKPVQTKMMRIIGLPEVNVINTLVSWINAEEPNTVNYDMLADNELNVNVAMMFNPETGRPVILGAIDYTLDGTIRNIIVNSGYRRLGIGKGLLKSVSELMLDNNVVPSATVKINNVPARNLFLKAKYNATEGNREIVYKLNMEGVKIENTEI
jgi:hypothetical protein